MPDLPSAQRSLVEAVYRDGWHEAYNLNPEDWDEVAARMLAALEGESTDPYALDVVNELIRRGSAMAQDRDRYRLALVAIAPLTDEGVAPEVMRAHALRRIRKALDG